MAITNVHFCSEAYPVVKAIQKRLGNRLGFALRSFPLSNSHPHALHAAEAAEAASERGLFWEMHDLLYENQHALEAEDLIRYAMTLHLDAERLMSEVLSGAQAARVPGVANSLSLDRHSRLAKPLGLKRAFILIIDIRHEKSRSTEASEGANPRALRLVVIVSQEAVPHGPRVKALGSMAFIWLAEKECAASRG